MNIFVYPDVIIFALYHSMAEFLILIAQKLLINFV